MLSASFRRRTNEITSRCNHNYHQNDPYYLYYIRIYRFQYYYWIRITNLFLILPGFKSQVQPIPLAPKAFPVRSAGFIFHIREIPLRGPHLDPAAWFALAEELDRDDRIYRAAAGMTGRSGMEYRHGSTCVCPRAGDGYFALYAPWVWSRKTGFATLAAAQQPSKKHSPEWVAAGRWLICAAGVRGAWRADGLIGLFQSGVNTIRILFLMQ